MARHNKVQYCSNPIQVNLAAIRRKLVAPTRGGLVGMLGRKLYMRGPRASTIGRWCLNGQKSARPIVLTTAGEREGDDGDGEL